MLFRTLPLILLPLIACKGGDKDDTDPANDPTSIPGHYEITRHTESVGSCEEGNDVDFPIPMVRLDETTDGDIEVYFCRDTSDCNDFPEVIWGLSQVEGDWYGSEWAANISEQEQLCALFFDERLLETPRDGVVRIERAQYNGWFDTLDEQECQDEGSSWEGRGGACIGLEVLRGEKVIAAE